MPKSIPDTTISSSKTTINSLTALFHLVRSLIPTDKELITISPDTTVAVAAELMQKHNISQLPVVAGDEVLGVFSFRSLVTHLLNMGNMREYFGDLRVDELMEQFEFAQPSDNWEAILDYLERDNGTLVGSRTQLEGIVTSMDVLNYLRKIAHPFVMVAEIELSLRSIIQACVNDTELQVCIQNSLTSKYDASDIPTKLLDMTFNDYVQVICDGRNWFRFSVILGEGEWQRKITAARLKELRDLRNDVFHFRRSLDYEDHRKLAAHRGWLQIKARAFEARKRQEQMMSSQPEVTKPDEKRKWGEDSLLEELQTKGRREEAEIAKSILEWARDRSLRVLWGENERYGNFYVMIEHSNVVHHLIAVSTGQKSGYVQLQFGKLLQTAPFDDESKRREFLIRLNEIEGIELPENSIERYPGIFLPTLKEKKVLARFLEALDWSIEEIRVTPL